MNDGIPILSRTPTPTPLAIGAIGKVASPPHRESTSEEFYFWVAPDTLVEKSQIVRTESTIGEQRLVFYGLIREVYRQSRQSDLGEEFDRHDGDVGYQPPFDSPGFTYAEVTILRTEPAVFAPPLEGSDVFLGGEAEARMAYSFDEIENPLVVGRVRNGGNRFAGPGCVDLDYLLGANGGHLNVNGVAGRGTKSSLLLHFNYMLLREARRQQRERPADRDRLRIVPIILNVKNFDLFHIDRRSKRYDPAKYADDWQALGIDDPAPFQNVTFYAPQQVNLDVPINTGRPKADVKAYSWSLRDVVERGLFSYLFADEDVRDANFGALALAMELWLTKEKVERDNTRHRILVTGPDRPAHFQALLDLVSNVASGQEGSPWGPSHHTATIRKLHRRLFRLVYDGNGVLRRDSQQGKPLDIRARDSRDPVVVDLNGLSAMPALQRFVVAAIFDQLVAERTGSHAQRGLIYLVTLDELNRFAPRGSHDPITELIERVAAEMRSQGIILLGAQQQASLVSGRVIENAGIRALGKSGSLELGDPVWRFLSESARKKASMLLPEEKLLIQDSFREPLLVKVPFPPWALRGADAVDEISVADAATEFDDP
ncbi:MAG TPA: ATP-binding protein [Gemmataceae bacterium]|nr:ATP-binding protein [Gemmataceae bacterium]